MVPNQFRDCCVQEMEIALLWHLFFDEGKGKFFMAEDGKRSVKQIRLF